MRLMVSIASMTLLALTAWGQSPISADISSQRVAVNEVFNITINANGSDVKEPDMQTVRDAGFAIDQPSQQSSTSMSLLNGRTTVVQSRTWRYPVSMTKAGSFTIPRIPVTVDGKEYLTQPMTIEISRTMDMGSQGANGTKELGIDDLAFVRASTNKAVVYQGETVLLQLRIYRLDQNYVEVYPPRALPLPETEGFYSGQQWQQNHNEQHEGRNYRITEINQILYPAMPGEQIIGSWQWQGVVGWNNLRGRQQTAQCMFATDPITITALPLPPQPPNFSGTVGKFRMQSHLSEENLTQGKPVRLIVSISGEGNPNTISAPSMPEMSWAHISDPEVETRTQDDNIQTTKLFSYLLTPLEAGEQIIPPLEFTFFAPILKNYKTERSPEKIVTVQPSADGNAFVAIGGSAEDQRRKIDVFDGDMLPIITDTQPLTTPAAIRSKRLGIAALFSPVLSAILLAAVYVALQQRRRLSRDSGYARRYYAKANCLKALDEAKEAKDATEILYRTITTFVGDMLNLNEAGLTSSEVKTLLCEKKVPEELVAEVSRMLKTCERAHYAGHSPSDEEVNALCADAQEVMKGLYEALKEKQS